MFDIVTIWYVSYTSICEYFTNIFNVLTTNIWILTNLTTLFTSLRNYNSGCLGFVFNLLLEPFKMATFSQILTYIFFASDVSLWSFWFWWQLAFLQIPWPWFGSEFFKELALYIPRNIDPLTWVSHVVYRKHSSLSFCSSKV